MKGLGLVCVTDEPQDLQAAIEASIVAYATPDKELGWLGSQDIMDSAHELSGWIIERVGL